MTKTEGDRLAIVETLISGLIKDIILLKEFLIEKITSQEKAIGIAMVGQKEAIGIAMVASEKAIVKAEIANDLRFGELDKKIADSVKSIDANIAALTVNQNLNTGARTGAIETKTSAKDIVFYLLFAIALIGFIISFFVK